MFCFLVLFLSYPAETFDKALRSLGEAPSARTSVLGLWKGILFCQSGMTSSIMLIGRPKFCKMWGRGLKLGQVGKGRMERVDRSREKSSYGWRHNDN